MNDRLNVTVYDGKYTVIQDEQGRTRALRYGEEWRDCIGDGLILALAQEVDILRSTDAAVARVAEFHTTFGCAITPEPWMPELSLGDRQLMATVASDLARYARMLKVQCAEANDLHRAALGLLLVRIQLLVEETGELANAFANQDLPNALQELSDISYVANGTYLTLGLQDVKVAADIELHDANMSKILETAT
jgi:predicted HAD superfamily Cof-like phosphohydrolase